MRVHDGERILAELNIANTTQLLRRYVSGAGADETLVWYEGSGTSDRRFLHQDERGSVVAVSDSSGAVLNVNTYDEYGIPRSTNMGRFQYTGQAWLPELGMAYYKARIYSPSLGRFLQTDPIGFAGGLNIYGYGHSDPINRIDPTGLDDDELGAEKKPPEPPNAKKPRTVCVQLPGSRHVVCAPILDYNHDGKTDGKDVVILAGALADVMQYGLDQVRAEMRDELKRRTSDVVHICVASQGSLACEQAKDRRMEIFNAYNQLTPLPTATGNQKSPNIAWEGFVRGVDAITCSLGVAGSVGTAGLAGIVTRGAVVWGCSEAFGLVK